MKIDVNELRTQIKLALIDVFEALITEKDQEITLVFTNGQKFSLKVSEKQKRAPNFLGALLFLPLLSFVICCLIFLSIDL